MTDTVYIVCPHCHSTNRVPQTRLQDHPKCGHCQLGLLDEHPIALNADSFMRHTQRSQLPVVVDFWAPWCGPCKMMAPAYAQAAKTLQGEAQLTKLDTEAFPQVAAPYNIRSIPTMAVFVEGKELARTSGAMPAGEIVRWVKSVIEAAH